MRKLVTLFVFLAITGMTTACGGSPVGLAWDDCPDGGMDPNGVCGE